MTRYPIGKRVRDVRYDAQDRIASFTHWLPDGTPQPALDQQFGYDENDRLTSVVSASSSWAISYDPNSNRDGQRIRKFNSTGPQSTVLFVYDVQGQLLGEYDHQGRAIREYIWLDDVPVAMFTPDPANASGPPLIFHIHADHLNAPRAVFDTDGVLRWQWLAEPFGTTAAEGDPSGRGPFVFNLRFPGQYADVESGLFYNWTRYYDPRDGRYTQSDSIGLDGGINTYAYVAGNPVSMVDPTGEFGIAGAVLGGGVELGLQLILNGGNLKCVDWWAVGMAGASGAIGGAALNGVFKLSRGSMKWENVRRRYRRGHDVPGSQDVHHWAMENGGPIARQLERIVGREGKDAIVNHPANLQAVDRAVHQGIHNAYGPLGRWWYGTPGWAKAVQGSAGVGAAGEALQDCECSR